MGFDPYRLTTDTAKAISGHFPSIAYIRDPTMDWYIVRNSGLASYPGFAFQVDFWPPWE